MLSDVQGNKDVISESEQVSENRKGVVGLTRVVAQERMIR